MPEFVRKTLSDRGVKTAKAPSVGRTEILDAIIPQLALRLNATGEKRYVVRTRLRGVKGPDGKDQQIRRTLGDPAVLSLDEARDLAGEVLKYAKRGIDILKQREKETEAAADAATAPQRLEWVRVREQFIEDHARPHQRRWQETERIFEIYVDPVWKGRLLTAIDRDDVLELILKLKKQRGVYVANRTLAHIRKLFNWAALQPRMLKTTPVVRGMTQPGEKSRDRVLSDDELRAIWEAAGTLPAPFKQYVQLLMLTGQRTGEIKALEWSEINKADGLIEFSAVKYKNRRPHIVPMTPMVAEIIGTLPKFDDCSYAVTTNGKTPVDSDTYVRNKLDAAIVAAGHKPIKDWRPHDIRRTVRTNLSKLGIPSDIGERVMGHVIGGVRGVYDRHSFNDEKRRALTAWEGYLSRVIGRTSGDNVLTLRKEVAS
jgi:integrase